MLFWQAILAIFFGLQWPFYHKDFQWFFSGRLSFTISFILERFDCRLFILSFPKTSTTWGLSFWLWFIWELYHRHNRHRSQLQLIRNIRGWTCQSNPLFAIWQHWRGMGYIWGIHREDRVPRIVRICWVFQRTANNYTALRSQVWWA